MTPLKFQPVEGECPWAWAKKCLWNAYELQSEKLFSIPEKVSIHKVARIIHFTIRLKYSSMKIGQ